MSINQPPLSAAPTHPGLWRRLLDFGRRAYDRLRGRKTVERARGSKGRGPRNPNIYPLY